MPEAASPPAAMPVPAGRGRSDQFRPELQLTPELVKKIAARVYALMLADIQIENERRRLPSQKPSSSNGGNNAV